MLPLLLVASFLGLARAQEPAQPGPSDRFGRALGRVRAAREDLDVRPARWDTRLQTPAIEELLADPLGLPDRSGEWGRKLAEAKGLADFAALSELLLGLPTESPRAAPPAASTGAATALPLPVAAAVADIVLAVAQARPFLDMALAGVPEAERGRLADAMLRHLFHGRPERLDPQAFDLAARFDLSALLQAVRGVAESVDRAAVALSAADVSDAPLPRTLVVAGSTVTLGGRGDDDYSADELRASTLVLDLGGKNRYLGAPAAAGPGEIRVVIDLSPDVVIDSSGSVATGRFGIGILHLGNPAGAKRLRGGPFSLGAGVFGAGLLVARGTGSRFDAGDFSQGAAAFGLGVLDAEGDGAALVAPFTAQGFGFTRGVGLLRVKGRAAKLECGLVYPDPRDEVAAVSLCQGTGYGPRAFAAGGFGLAVVESDAAEIESNYFAQGSGYWHGFGGFYFSGNGARIQSRRYGQGAGVHTALGAFELAGHENRLLHWGVGPGFGWDWGVGFAAVRGDRNQLYADWASGKGDVNGHGLTLIEGSANRIRLGELATGTLKRSAPSYGVVVVSGTASRVWIPRLSSATAAGAVFQPSLWGAAEFDGDAVLDPALVLEVPVWRGLESARAEAARSDREWNAARLAEADRLPAPQRLAQWFFLASEGGLEGQTPAEALSRLLVLPDEEVSLLPDLVAAERFNEFLYLRTIIPGYGRRIAPALLRGLAAASGMRKALLLGFLRSFPAEMGAKAAQGALGDKDWRVRREALGTLGALFDRQVGEEPGRVAFLEETLALCRRPVPEEPVPAEVLARIAQKRLSDLFAVLALADAPQEDRVAVFRRAPDPFSPVPADALHAFIQALGRRPKACVDAVSKELKDIKRLEGPAAERLAQAVEEGTPDLLPVALASLGALGRAKDAERMVKALAEGNAATREAAAIGLARMGSAAEKATKVALKSPDPRVRAMAVAAAAQSSAPQVFRLLAQGFEDPEESVRLAAVAAPFGAQAPLNPLRKEFVPALERLAETDPSTSVRAGAAYAAANFR